MSVFNKQLMTFMKVNGLNIPKFVELIKIITKNRKIKTETVLNWLETDHGACDIDGPIMAAIMHLENCAPEYGLKVPKPSISEGVIYDVLDSMIIRGEVEKIDDGYYQAVKKKKSSSD